MQLSDVRAKATQLWESIPAKRRPVVIGSVVLVVLILAGWTYFAGRPEFVVLYSRLSVQDASQIVEVLEADGTPYRLAAGGATVLVPAREVHSARLALAGKGLPNQGTPGFELLDSVSMGATEFEKRTAFVRALSGELARTISEISEVESARVHVVLPEQSLFTSQARPTTAAVFVRHSPGARLDPEQVQGIIHLVAHSVEGLDPESVTVVDEGGRVLSTGLAQGQSSAGRAEMNLDAGRRVAADIESSLQRLLEQVLGPGNVATRVAAEVSFDESVVESVMFLPAGDSEGLVRSVQELTEYFRGGQAGDGGVAGTQGNVPIYQTEAAAGGTESESERTEVVKNFELNEVREHTVVAPGALKRLSVSVVCNQELAAADAERLERLVSAAVGSDPARNDQIVVTGMPFNTDLATAVAADMAAARRRQTIFTAAGAGLGLIAGLIVFLRVRRTGRRRAEEPVVVAEEVVGAELPPAEAGRLKAHEEVQRLFRANPQAAAQLIRSWLVEE